MKTEKKPHPVGVLAQMSPFSFNCCVKPFFESFPAFIRRHSVPSAGRGHIFGAGGRGTRRQMGVSAPRLIL